MLARHVVAVCLSVSQKPVFYENCSPIFDVDGFMNTTFGFGFLKAAVSFWFWFTNAITTNRKILKNLRYVLVHGRIR